MEGKITAEGFAKLKKAEKSDDIELVLYHKGRKAEVTAKVKFGIDLDDENNESDGLGGFDEAPINVTAGDGISKDYKEVITEWVICKELPESQSTHRFNVF